MTVMMRDWAMAGAGAVLGTLGTLGALALNGNEARRPEAESHRRAGERETARGSSTGEVAFPLRGAEPPGATRETTRAATRGSEPVALRSAELLREKRDLESQLRTMETELQRMSDVPATGDPRDFELDAEEWKELAAEGRVKYRIPCLLPSESSYSMPQREVDALGLSSDEGTVLTEAHRRSNARIWSTVRPLCLQAIGNAEVVDLLGPSKCIDVIDKAATKRDFLATADARRHVAEVHAGLRSLPKEGDPQHPVFASLMAMTTEAERFQADLAESFGPEEAKRISDGMRCAATVR
jgi:hypothetical protein